jgi:hypothetical protein
MNILEEYALPDVACLLGSSYRTIERSLQEGLDQLSRMLVSRRLAEQLPSAKNNQKSSQAAKSRKFEIGDSNEAEYKSRKVVGVPPLI